MTFTGYEFIIFWTLFYDTCVFIIINPLDSGFHRSIQHSKISNLKGK